MYCGNTFNSAISFIDENLDVKLSDGDKAIDNDRGKNAMKTTDLLTFMRIYKNLKLLIMNSFRLSTHVESIILKLSHGKGKYIFQSFQ